MKFRIIKRMFRDSRQARIILDIQKLRKKSQRGFAGAREDSRNNLLSIVMGVEPFGFSYCEEPLNFCLTLLKVEPNPPKMSASSGVFLFHICAIPFFFIIPYSHPIVSPNPIPHRKPNLCPDLRIPPRLCLCALG